MAGWKATAALTLVLLFVTAHAQQLGDITGAIANHVDTVACNLAGQKCPPATPAPTPAPATPAPTAPAATTTPAPTPRPTVPPTPPGQGDNLTLIQTQVIGTFQSTHQAPPQSVYNLLNSAPYQAVFVAKGQNIPQRYAFSHQTITQQLQSGIRGFEFDTLSDPVGGKYAYAAGLKLAGATNTLISPDLLQPGVKAMTSPDFDFGASCYLFKSCLGEIAAFSKANPRHFPIVVFIHHGGTTPASSFLGAQYAPALAQLQANPTVQPTNFTQGVNARIVDIRAEISSVFAPAQLYTPDNLRADNKANATANLRDIVLAGAALNGSWPTIGALRGKVLFFADPDYTGELDGLYPGAQNSLLWPSNDNGDSDPNHVVLDVEVDVDLANYTTTPYSFDTNAAAQVTAGSWAIQAIGLQGFYMRAGVDSTAVEAQFNYTTRANAFQKTGGATFISTFFDVLPPQNLLPSTYQVNTATQFGGAVAVCNPVLTGTQVTIGSVAYPYDGPIPQLGSVNIFQPPLPTCPVPLGFSA